MAATSGRELPAGVDADVLIVGAGPVGQVLALLLGRRGWRVELLERQEVPFPLPRAVHLDHEASRILQAAGIMDELAPRTEVMDAYEWRTADGRTLLRLGTEPVGWSGWPDSAMFTQPDLEALLSHHLGSYGSVTVRRGSEVVGLAASADSVALTLAGGTPAGGTPAGGTVRRGRWVVGCDGAGSRVRQLLGVDLEELGETSEWLVVDVIPHRPAVWRPLNVQVCDPRRPTTAVSGGPGRRRWEFMRLPGEPAGTFDTDERAWDLLRPWGLTPDDAVLERRARYRFAARVAERWTAGRVALAGDAAHQMPPFAGQGLCSGIRDAANLAWKLDAVLSGRAPEHLVRTYGPERRPQVRAAIEFSVDLGRIICVADPAEAAARDEAMVASAEESGAVPPPPPPPIGPGVTHPDDPAAGQLGRQGWVAAGGGRALLDDLVGLGSGEGGEAPSGWVLLSTAADPLAGLDRETAAWWEALGGVTVRLLPVDGSGPAPGRPTPTGRELTGRELTGPELAVVDIDGTYARWFAASGAEHVLQRPDFYVFGTARGTGGPSDLLRSARQALADTPL